jgi:KUP system potassium uptake protein
MELCKDCLPLMPKISSLFICFVYVSDLVVIVSIVILIGLFNMQHFGTDKVSRLFAPIVLLWFLMIGTVGAINLWKYDSTILKAFNPVNIFLYFKRGRYNWTSLGGIMLSITGTSF